MRKVENELTAGVDNSWMEREGDGYKAFSKAYDIEFKKIFPMQIGLIYTALKTIKWMWRLVIQQTDVSQLTI